MVLYFILTAKVLIKEFCKYSVYIQYYQKEIRIEESIYCTNTLMVSESKFNFE